MLPLWDLSMLARPPASSPSLRDWRLSKPINMGVSMPNSEPVEPLPRPVKEDRLLIMLLTPLLPNNPPSPLVPASMSVED